MGSMGTDAAKEDTDGDGLTDPNDRIPYMAEVALPPVVVPRYVVIDLGENAQPEFLNEASQVVFYRDEMWYFWDAGEETEMCSFNDFDVLALNPTGSAYVVPKSGDALVTDPHPDPLGNVWHEGELHPLEEPTTHSQWPAAVTRQQYDHARYLVTGFDSTMNVIIGTASGTVAVAEDHDPNGFCSGHANADIVWNLNGTIQSISWTYHITAEGGPYVYADYYGIAIAASLRTPDIERLCQEF